MKFSELESDNSWNQVKLGLRNNGFDVDKLFTENKSTDALGKAMNADKQVTDGGFNLTAMDKAMTATPDVVENGMNISALDRSIDQAQTDIREGNVNVETTEKPAWYQGLDWSGFSMPEQGSIRGGSARGGSVDPSAPKWMMNPTEAAPRMLNVDTALAQSMNRRRLRGLNLNSYGY